MVFSQVNRHCFLKEEPLVIDRPDYICTEVGFEMLKQVVWV